MTYLPKCPKCPLADLQQRKKNIKGALYFTHPAMKEASIIIILS